MPTESPEARSASSPNAVCELVARLTGIPLKRLDGAARLVQDLGIDGDDAEKVMEEFAIAFGVDLSGFVFNRHFNCEPSIRDPFWFLPSRRRARMEREAITIAHLQYAAITGRWTDAT